MTPDDKEWYVNLFSFFLEVINGDEESNINIILGQIKRINETSEIKELLDCYSRLLEASGLMVFNKSQRILRIQSEITYSKMHDDLVRMQGGT